MGPFFAGPLTDSKLGRRGAMQVGAILICLGEIRFRCRLCTLLTFYKGTAVISSSMEKPQFIGGWLRLKFLRG